MFLIGAVAPLQSQFLPLLITRDSAMTLISGRYQDSVHFQKFFGEGENRDTLSGLLDVVQLSGYILSERTGRAELQFDSLERLVKFTWETGSGLLRQQVENLQPDSASVEFVHASHCQTLFAVLSNHYGLKDSGIGSDTTFMQLRWPTDTMLIMLAFDNPRRLSAVISYPNPLPRKSQFMLVSVRPAEETNARPPIIDNNADGQEQLRKGIDSAVRNGKRPLLLLGAAWCARCDSLYYLMMNDSAIAQMLEQDFQLVLVNISGPDYQELNRQLGDPWQLGLPVLMVMDSDGVPRNTSELSAMQVGESYDSIRVRRLLQEWQK